MVNSTQNSNLTQSPKRKYTIGEYFFVDFDSVNFFSFLMPYFVDLTVGATANDTKILKLLPNKLIDK